MAVVRLRSAHHSDFGCVFTRGFASPWHDMLTLGATLLIKMIENDLAIAKIGIRFATLLGVQKSTRQQRSRAEFPI
jgi:hypothetical protein